MTNYKKMFSVYLALRFSVKVLYSTTMVQVFDSNKYAFCLNAYLYFFGVLLTVHLSIFISVSLWYHHTYRCDDTRGCVMQFWPPDDECLWSKHVEAWNKTYCVKHFVHQVG